MGGIAEAGLRPGRGACPPLLAWRQRRFAKACCRQLLALRAQALQAQPALAGMALYRQVVAAQVGDDPVRIDAVLQGAEASYASWPTPRALSFRDVAHFLVVSGCWRRFGDGRVIEADLRRAVDRAIPHQL